jgi:hypothetical protein
MITHTSVAFSPELMLSITVYESRSNIYTDSSAGYHATAKAQILLVTSDPAATQITRVESAPCKLMNTNLQSSCSSLPPNHEFKGKDKGKHTFKIHSSLLHKTSQLELGLSLSQLSLSLCQLGLSLSQLRLSLS